MDDILILVCARCRNTQVGEVFRNPSHLAHPVDAKVMLFDARGEAECPTCGAKWRRSGNQTELIARAQRKAPKKAMVAKPAPASQRKPGPTVRKRHDS